jgi:hypothetical protein
MSTIYQLLANVMNEVGAIAKMDKHTQSGYNFRGIDAVVNAVNPALRANGVIVVPQISDYWYGEILVGKNRSPMGHARVIVNYTFYGPEGDSIVAAAPGEAFDSGDKATPKAMSVAFRTALLQALALPTSEVDPDAHSFERSEATDDQPPPPDTDPLAQQRRYHSLRVNLGWDEDQGHRFIANVMREEQPRQWRTLDADGRYWVLHYLQKALDEAKAGAGFLTGPAAGIDNFDRATGEVKQQ